MLVHLSNTSPYVCDLNRGPIEQANRMASAPTKKATALLEHKESFPKATRTPLKLLAPDEVPMDTTATATDINASLQPIWYSEQTIIDDYQVQQSEDIASIIQEQQQQQQKGRSLRPRTTLPTIPSESPIIPEEEIEQLPAVPSIMHKSSTFTIEQAVSIVDSPLNDSEKENLVEDNQTNQMVQPSDDSFRALEELLGLGSANTVRESLKTNHDTLSLTVVTPTDIINATTNSLRLSYAPKKDGSDSLPSSQEIPIMPTIESIDSINPPSFLMDNTTMEEEQPSIAITATTTMNQQDSFDLTENDTIKDDTNTDDETNFSFELNDFPNNSTNESAVNVPEPTPPMINVRAPTCADVAYRALIKPRRGGRISQPVKADSPLAQPNKNRSSAPTSRMLRSSCRRISSDSPSPIQEQPIANPECFVNEDNINTGTQLTEIVSVPEEDEVELEKTTSITLNLTKPETTEEINDNESMETERITTPPKPMMPTLSREYTYNTPKRRSSQRRRSMLNASRATPIQQQQTTMKEDEMNSSSMLGILLTKPTEARQSSVRNSSRKTINSPAITSKSMLNVLLTKPVEAESTPVRSSTSIVSKSMLDDLLINPIEAESTPVRSSGRKTTNSPAIASKSMLGVLLTQPTESESTPVRSSKRKTTDSPAIASKSMLNVLLTQPTEIESTPVRSSGRKTTNSPAIASKSMLGVLLTQPTETESTPVRSSKRKTTDSPAIASKSMLGVLLTQPTEETSSPVRTSTRKTINSPSVTSKSMLEVLLTKPTESESLIVQTSVPDTPSIASESMLGILLTNPTAENQSPVRTSTRMNERASSNGTPKVSINPLHSSTPSSSRHKSLQIVSIGEEEQVSTIVPQQINNEPQETEIMPIDNAEESIEQQSMIHLIETGVQTTPSLDISSRRRLNTLENQTTPIPIINEQKQITPLQTKAIMNLQRKVCFQLTPSTDARLVAKEKLEENLRGLKPDIVITPIPIITETIKEIVKVIPVKKAAKPKKKVIASKKKKAQPKSKQPAAKKTVQVQEVKPISPRKRVQRKQPTPVVVTPPKETKPKQRTQRKQPAPAVVAPPKQRAPRKQPTPVVAAPTKRTQKKQPTPEVIKPIERASRKRTITEVTTEPIVKRAKISKSVEVVPPTKKRNLSNNNNNQKIVPEPIERQTRTRSRSTRNTKPIPEPIIKTESVTKTSKRRLQSVEKTEGIKKKAEEEKVQSIPPVQSTELSQEERHKIEALTVAALKSRLNTHKADIPKGAKKAELIALLIQIETNLIKPKPIETPTVNTTSMTTRRRKN